MPGCDAWLASPLRESVAHTMPVPGPLPFAESESMPPGMPPGARMVLCALAGVTNKPLTRRNTLCGAAAGKTDIDGAYVGLFQNTRAPYMRAAVEAWKL